MKKRDYSEVDAENADEICAKIKAESGEEAASILEKAEREKERLVDEAVKEATLKASTIRAESEKKIQGTKERIFSTVNMEKKRIGLNEKSRFIDNVISIVNKKAQALRSDKSYPEFLKDAIREGLEVMGNVDAEIFYSDLDENIIKSGIVKDIKAEFKKSEFKDIGVIVQSKDGRMFFDNRFSARLKRSYDAIYTKLLREAF